jgi:glutathione synthase/RimK-type ligase-like ATP-grasp enzyme
MPYRNAPLVVLYEHPDWFRPLFAELDRRGAPHVRVHTDDHSFDAASSPGNVSLVFNRMSPSAWKRGRAGAIAYTRDYLSWLDVHDVPVLNGSDAFHIETSKALQLSLLSRLGIAAPRTRVVSSIGAIPAAAESLTFPIVVKPNIGGSGAGIVRFDSYLDLVQAVYEERIAAGIDGVILVQEYHRPANNSIVRVETLEGRYLYGIRVHLGDTVDEFNLCPADVCRTVDGRDLTSAACAAGAQKLGLRVEAYTPPREIIDAVEKISRAAKIDVGGIEYLESSRDGRLYFYDVNALSNFVADPLQVLGFDPTARLVDAIETRLLRRVA